MFNILLNNPKPKLMPIMLVAVTGLTGFQVIADDSYDDDDDTVTVFLGDQ